MGKGIAEKILSTHLVSESSDGKDIVLHVDSTLIHDMSGPLALIGFDAMGIDDIQVDLPVAFIDHNLVGMDFRSPDDHLFVTSAAKKYGMMLSSAGNGVCHSVYYHRLGRPGTILVGADSHSATAGALGMLGIGLGGLDVSAIMGGEDLTIARPRIVNVNLTGSLRPGSSAKDVALALLGRLGVKGCVGAIVEYTGPGVKTLSVHERATIANMGAEMGATTSVFPSDDVVYRFLKAQSREADFVEILPERDAEYSRTLTLALDSVRPMVAVPPMPDQAVPVDEAGEIPVNQVYIGSCVNGSYVDIARAALVLHGRRVHPDVTLLVSPGNRQVFQMLLRDGHIATLVEAGARILECGCGPCIGLSQAPASGSVTVRTTNRNYPGRSGTKDAGIYLTGTETAAATAVLGYLASADKLMDVALLDTVRDPEVYPVDDARIYRYDLERIPTPLRWGPNLKPMPLKELLETECSMRVVLKVGDDTTTDDILPPGPEVLGLRPNIPELSKYLFSHIDPGFYSRAREYGSSVIVGGENYGQGSSREHAAIGPMYLGVKAVLVKSIARIHRSNLINYGIMPLIFDEPGDYDRVSQGDLLEMTDIPQQLGRDQVVIRNRTTGREIVARAHLSPKELELVKVGGLFRYIRNKREGAAGKR